MQGGGEDGVELREVKKMSEIANEVQRAFNVLVNLLLIAGEGAEVMLLEGDSVAIVVAKDGTAAELVDKYKNEQQG